MTPSCIRTPSSLSFTSSRTDSALFTSLLFLAILTVWIPARWHVGLFRAAIFALAFASLARILRRPEPLPFRFPLIPLAGAVLWGLLQLLFRWTVYRFETWDAVLTWTACLAVFWLALRIFSSPHAARGFLRALLWFGFALAVLSTVQYFAAPGKIFGLIPAGYRNVGPFLNRDHYSTFVELVLPLALWEALRGRRKTLSHALIAAALFASVIAGASRAGSILVTLEIALVLFLGLSPRFLSSGTLRRALAWTALFAVAFAAVVGWDVLWKRFQEPDPFAGRREMLQASLAMLRDRPWTGFGLGAWPLVYPAYAVWDPGLYVNHAHNDWAEWAAEGGLPFLLLVLSLALWSARQALRFPWGLGVVSAFCHCAVDFPMRRPAIAALLFALMGVLAAARPRHPTPPSDLQHPCTAGTHPR